MEGVVPERGGVTKSSGWGTAEPRQRCVHLRVKCSGALRLLGLRDLLRDLARDERPQQTCAVLLETETKGTYTQQAHLWRRLHRGD